MLDELWAEKSMVRAALQHLSGLLQGTASRLRLIWGLSGTATVEEWVDAHPEEAATVRSLVLLAVSWVERRFYFRFHEHRWQLLGLGDLRRDDQDRAAVAQGFLSQRRCR